MTTPTTLARSFPTFRYLLAPLRWVIETRRRRRTAALAVLAMAAAPVVWWTCQLWGLPDVGEPFDVEAYRAIRIADDRNAFVLYIRAAELLESLKKKVDPPWYSYERQVPWSKASPAMRRLFEEDRPAMVLFREAAERPDSWPILIEDPRAWVVWNGLRRFHLLAMLEASRLEEQGDMAGAWGWYRASLRTLHHERRCGGFAERQEVAYRHGRLRDRLKAWAADPRTTAADLRRALDDATACGAIAAPESDTLKREYRWLRKQLDESGPQDSARRLNNRKSRLLFGSADDYLRPEQMQTIYDLWRIWHREPERRRRIARLAVANWLAYYELPPGRRPPPDLNVTGPYDFFAHGPDAPAAAHALSPAVLDRWLDSSPEARQKLDLWMGGFRMSSDWIGKLRAKETAGHRALLVLLASELYRRDHGQLPIRDEELVGPYLKALPDDGLDGSGMMKEGSR